MAGRRDVGDLWCFNGRHGVAVGLWWRWKIRWLCISEYRTGRLYARKWQQQIRASSTWAERRSRVRK
jgi:hypothetical protein